MQKIGKFTPTGRKLAGPGADLIELDSDNGLRHTAVVFQPQYQNHRAINGALDVVRSFLEAPLVTGLVELVEHDRAQGAFVYPTGQSWSVAEVIRSLADQGEIAGLRAGLELMFSAGQILTEAADIGAMSGVYSHGGLTPWRILLKADGQALVIGYALPQVEILQFHEDPSQVPREDSFRYCPPERIEFESENLTSDLFGLALIAFELMTGKPVYDGLVDDIRQQAARGEGSRRLFKFREQIPEGVRQLLTTALRPSPADRHASGQAFLDEVRRLLSSGEAKGPSLMEIMEKVASQGQRFGKAVDGGQKTQMLSKDELVRMMQDEDGPQEPRRQAWTPGASSRRAGPSVAPAPAEPPPAAPRAPVAAPAAPRAAVSPVPPRTGPVSTLAGGLAEQLLARMRADAEPEAPRSEGPRPGSLTPPDAEAGEGAGRFTPGRVRRAPRRTAVEGMESISGGAEPAAPSAAAAAPSAAAAAPSAADRPVSRVAPPPPPRQPPAPSPPPITPPPITPPPITPPPITPPAVTAALHPPSRVPSVPPEEEESDGTSAQSTLVEELPPSPSPGLRSALPAAASQVPGHVGFSAASQLGRTPDSLLSGRKGGTESYSVSLGAGGRPVRIRLPVKASTAEAVSFLVGYVVPVRTDLCGALAGWYRVDQDGRQIPATTPLEQLDASKPLVLRFVPNQIAFADIEVSGAPAPVRFVAPVGTAVPASCLVDHLASWLALPPGRWRLHRNGRAVDSHGILSDDPVAGLYRLVLAVVEGEDPEVGAT